MSARIGDATLPLPREHRGRMTMFGSLLSLFPALIVGLSLLSVVWLFYLPGTLPCLSLLTVLYLLPLAAYRLHQRILPVTEGACLLVGRGYAPWFGSHQLQLIYIAFPWLETLLRLVPGLFSLWLRAWGSRIGRGVYWTPHVEILDRGLLEVGDRVIFGHRTGVSGHVIRPTRDNILLFVKRVQIGSGAFIGAGSYIGPGVVVEAGTMLKAASYVMPRQKVSAP